MISEELEIYELARLAQDKAIRKRRRRTRATPRPRADAPAARLSPAQRAGRQAEEQVCRYLEAAGLIVLARNMTSRTGEIDVVCRDGHILAFIEVRLRRSAQFGGAAASVGPDKQQRLIRTARHFLPLLARRHFNGAVPQCRFDVVAVEPRGLVWLKQAFSVA